MAARFPCVFLQVQQQQQSAAAVVLEPIFIKLFYIFHHFQVL